MATTTTTKEYELTIIVDETATQETIDELTEKLKEFGKVTKVEDDGVKRLAYPIQRVRLHEKGHFMFYQLELENGAPQMVSEYLSYNDNALRHLLVRVSK